MRTLSASSTRQRARRLAVALATVVLGATLAGGNALHGVEPASGQNPPKPEAAGDLTAAAGPGASVGRAPGDGPLHFIGVPHGQSIAVEGAGGGAVSTADAFVAEFGAAFGADTPGTELEVTGAAPLGGGGKSVRYQQTASGVPVLAGELRVQVNADNEVISAGGELSTADAVGPDAGVDPVDASTTATDAVAAEHDVDAADLSAGEPALIVYDPSLVGEGDGPSLLAWQVEVTGDGTVAVRETVLVDAQGGEVVLSIDGITHARSRFVCDNANVSGASYTCTSGYARTEGQAATGVDQVDKAYDLSGDTYDFFQSRFGRDSIDGSGLALRSTVRHCPTGEPCPYQNAFWDGAQMVYGDGFADADDVVGHELTHGITEYTSNLVYLNQSGAINESLSDVFGEFVDLTNGSGNDAASVRWDMGEDVPGFGALRDMADPGRFGDPDRMGSPNYYNGSADSGGVHTNSGVNNKAASLMVDGGSFNGETITGIGITKTARVYYEAETTLLGSGSSYTDLGNYLGQACANVTGVDGITAGDCTQVAAAVTATEMITDPPPNDDFADAEALTGASGTLDAGTAGASKEAGEPNHAGNAGGASIWYRFTAGSTGTATIDTVGSNYDTTLAAYTGSSVGALTQVAANDDTSGLQSEIQFTATAGTTYRVAVDGYNGIQGDVTLNWTVPAGAGPSGINGTVTDAGSGQPVPGAFVAVLRTSDFSAAAGVTADGNGDYSALVAPGAYYLYLIDPTATHAFGFHGPPTTVTVTAGNVAAVDSQMASTLGGFAGTVTEDGSGTPLGGVWVIAIDGAGVAGATVTAGDGTYTIAGLRPGNFRAEFVDITGGRPIEFWDDSPTPAGSTAFAVTAATTTPTIDAGLAPPP